MILQLIQNSARLSSAKVRSVKDYLSKIFWYRLNKRILVRSKIAQRIFNSDEVLLPAKKLLPLDGVEVVEDNPDGVECFHILFDQHEIIYSNGAATESLLTGPQALKAVSREARAELETLFPEICDPDFEPISARLIPDSGKDMRELVARHVKNNKPMFLAA